MKIQNLAVIFIIIILPISLILTSYVQNQVKTLSLQTSYDTKLNNCTYDALKAFQLNTVNSSTSDLTNSKMRDIEASVNTFFNSMASNFNMSGYNSDILKEYVPALVYTMYDGYYIYSPFTNTLSDTTVSNSSTYKDGEKLSGLKPYIYYSCRYVSGYMDVVITYSLDNYISVVGTNKAGEGISISGYLIDNISDVVTDSNGNPRSVKYRGITIDPEDPPLQEYIGDNHNPENLYEYIKSNGVKYYKYKDSDNKSGWFTLLNGEKYQQSISFNDGKNYSAVQYYANAAKFKQELFDNGLLELTTANAVGVASSDTLHFENRKIFTDDSKSIEEPDSNFNIHRLEVIKYSIEKNLSIAIANYNNYGEESKANFQMPKLKEDEWDKLLNNISIISFLQGLNIGGKVYNGYSIINNNKNKEVVTENSIYIASDDGYYHNIREKDLDKKTNSMGILNIDFERVSKISDTGAIESYYPKKYLADYTSVVSQSNVNDEENIYKYLDGCNDSLKKLYYTALGRERNGTYKVSQNAQVNLNQSATAPTFNITINYKNQIGGNILKQDIISGQKEGKEYDLTDKKYDTITPNLATGTKYKLVDYTDGDSITGTLESDITVNFYYKELLNYNVTLKYLDSNNNEIKTSRLLISNQEEESNYDVSETIQDAIKETINGYTYTGQEGDSTSGTLDTNKEIILRYRKLETYTVTLKYLDLDQKEVKTSDQLRSQQEGTNYDVSTIVTNKINETIQGYAYKSQSGDNLSGTLDSNKVIILNYKKLETYTIKLQYLSNDNQVLKSEIILKTGLEDSTYDVTEEVSNNIALISGYVYNGRQGDAISGTLDGNKIIKLYYNSLPIPTVELKNNRTYYNGSNWTVLSRPPSQGGVNGNGVKTMTVSSTFKITNNTSSGREQLLISTTEGSGWALRLDDHRRVNFELYTGSGYTQDVYTSEAVELNRVYNVIGVYDGNNIDIYINGVLKKRASKPNITISQKWNTQTLISGNPVDNNTSSVNPNGGVYGYVYDSKIYYNTVLNAAQIMSLYNLQRDTYFNW